MQWQQIVLAIYVGWLVLSSLVESARTVEDRMQLAGGFFGLVCKYGTIIYLANASNLWR